MAAYRLNKKLLDHRGNRKEGWSIGEKRGNMDYDPPLGWIGNGLNVLNKFCNNTWIGMENIEGNGVLHIMGKFFYAIR